MGKVLTPTIGELLTILGYDGTDFSALKVDVDGHLQIDVLSAALASGAATSAKQDTMITALQLIDDLRAALGSVDTDDLQVDVKTSALPAGAATSARQQYLVDFLPGAFAPATHAAGTVVGDYCYAVENTIAQHIYTSMIYYNGTCSQIAAWLANDGTWYNFLNKVAPTVNVLYESSILVSIPYGWHIKVGFYGTSTNNYIAANTLCNVYNLEV